MSNKDERKVEIDEYKNLCENVVNNVVVAIITSFQSVLTENKLNEQHLSRTPITEKSDNIQTLSRQISHLTSNYIKNNISQQSNKSRNNSIDKSKIKNNSASNSRTKSNSIDKSDKNSNNSFVKYQEADKYNTATRESSWLSAKRRLMCKMNGSQNSQVDGSIIKSSSKLPLIITKSSKTPCRSESRKTHSQRVVIGACPSVCSALSQTEEYCSEEESQTIQRDIGSRVKATQAKAETAEKEQFTETNSRGSRSSQTQHEFNQPTVSASDPRKYFSSFPNCNAKVCIKEILDLNTQTDECDDIDNEEGNETPCLCRTLDDSEGCGCLSRSNNDYFAIAERLDQTEKKLQEMWGRMFNITQKMQDHMLDYTEHK